MTDIIEQVISALITSAIIWIAKHGYKKLKETSSYTILFSSFLLCELWGILTLLSAFLVSNPIWVKLIQSICACINFVVLAVMFFRLVKFAEKIDRLFEPKPNRLKKKHPKKCSDDPPEK